VIYAIAIFESLNMKKTYERPVLVKKGNLKSVTATASAPPVFG
jgi:hypothetical protein